LTQWSLQRASNSNIFEIHDTLEKQFFLVSQAFEEANVSMKYVDQPKKSHATVFFFFFFLTSLFFANVAICNGFPGNYVNRFPQQ
jgi:membrane-anchored glycerophosphoryl diester phosphodiesterase (GDPDase)